jgi:hypothetical protein
MNQLIWQHLIRSQERMKRQTDKKQFEREFDVGAMVYMKLQPYVQSSVMSRANQKLSFKYFGAFQILEHVGSVAYRQQLPVHSSIHLVVHVSQLKLAKGFKGSVSSQLPSHSLQHHVPLQILASCMVDHGDSQVTQVLIKWSELPTNLATWEDYEALKHAFPCAPAWGQAGLQEGGNVSTLPPLCLNLYPKKPTHTIAHGPLKRTPESLDPNG